MIARVQPWSGRRTMPRHPSGPVLPGSGPVLPDPAPPLPSPAPPLPDPSPALPGLAHRRGPAGLFYGVAR